MTVSLLDGFFASFRWWRRWRGGEWNEVAPRSIPSVGPLWVAGPAQGHEHVSATERW